MTNKKQNQELKDKRFDEFVKELKDKIEDAQEDYGDLDWVSKEQAEKIIQTLSQKYKGSLRSPSFDKSNETGDKE